MNGLNYPFQNVALERHDENLRRAAEYRLVREAQARGSSPGLIWRLFSRLALSEKTSQEVEGERTPRTAI